MSESTPTHAASHQRLRRAKQAIVLAVAGTTAAVWALVATNAVGVTSNAAADSQPNANPITSQPQVRTGDQGQGGAGFFGAPEQQPGFFGLPQQQQPGFFGGNDGFGQGGFNQGGSNQGGFGQGGFNQGGSGSSGAGTFGGGVGPMIQSGGS